MNGLTLLGMPVAWLLSLLLLVVIYMDLRHMRIPHWLLALVAILFVASIPYAVPMPDLLWRFAAAALVLLLCLAAFAARLLGGGDAKLLPLLLLFVAPGQWALFALFLSAGLITGLILVRCLRSIPDEKLDGWAGLTKRDRYPLGPGIGLAGVGFALLGPQAAGLF